MIDIQLARPVDGDALGEVHAAGWEAAYAPFFAPEFAAAGVRDRRTRWHARITNGEGAILLARVGGRPLALSWAGPAPHRPGWAEVFGFYGHPDGWGSGVAGALMTRTLDHLRAAGHTRVHLWTLRGTPRSRRFYEKSGYAPTGAERPYDFGDGRPLAQVEYARDC
ncbi:GNAT family N-acetyltransferase [Streptomyces sp. NPDC088674]|uniref:GNAT family N-acetyltransferase n=1 Tax=Streptomyces sp. NPDC088674 TaxID=3365869 RepID=UPI003827F3CF